MNSFLRLFVGVLIVFSAAFPVRLEAQADTPFRERFYILFANASGCSLHAAEVMNYRLAPREVGALTVAAMTFLNPLEVRMSDGQRFMLPARTHSEVRVNESCRVYSSSFDASTAEARFVAELHEIQERNARWTRRGTRQVLLGSLLSLGGVVGIASGSNTGIGLGAGGVAVGLGMVLNAQDDFRRGRLNLDEQNEVTRLNNWIRMFRSTAPN